MRDMNLYTLLGILSALLFLVALPLFAQKKDDATLTIHYHRYEADYDNPGLWTWDGTDKKSPKDAELAPVGRDDYGSIFKLNLDDYGLDNINDKIGLLPRLNKDWNRKDGDDRYWTPEMGMEIWLEQGKSIIHRQKPDVSPRVLNGFCDAAGELTVMLTHRMPAEKIKAENFTLTEIGGEAVPIVKAEPVPADAKMSAQIRLVLAAPLAYETKSYRIEAAGYKAAAGRNVLPRGILADPDKFYDKDVVLGATWSPEQTTFRVFAPTADRVFVILYDNPKGAEERAERPMEKKPKGIWETTVAGNLKNKYYVYRLTGSDLDPNLEVIDPYARCVTDRDGRGMVVDLAATNPPGFDPKKRPPMKNRTDAVIYEMHVREFTIDPASGVKNRGLFLGVTESGTRLAGDPDIKTGLDHLVELGVTHVQLMPIQDFDNDESVFDATNWGYMPVHFNSPDGWFATRRDDTTRVTEFKRLVQTLHENGIRVIMDVVYNHTAPPASFGKIVPNYYFRLRDDGTYYNGSGCGNEFKSENPMARKFILDSLKFWVEEYGADGFRFDLMGLIDLETMTEAARMLHALDPTILVYGEPWAGGGEVGIASITDKGKQKGLGFGAFNDDARNDIKGSPSGSDAGFIQSGERAQNLKRGIEAAIRAWAQEPDEALIYAEAHDDLTLWDKIAISSSAPESERIKMQNLAAAIVLTSQGIPFIHSGQEMCRTKEGISNAYNAPLEINQVKWNLKKTRRDVFDYCKGMIALRRAHPALRLASRAEIEKRLKFDVHNPSPRSIAYTIDAAGVPDESAKSIRVIFNADSMPIVFRMPPGKWRILAKDDKAGAARLGEIERSAAVAPYTALVCIQE